MAASRPTGKRRAAALEDELMTKPKKRSKDLEGRPWRAFEEDTTAPQTMEDGEDYDMDVERTSQSPGPSQAGDPAFDSLLYKLANLDVSGDKVETCPVCQAKLPIVKFADHVYECVNKLDTEQQTDLKKAQIERDHELASRMVAAQGCQADVLRYCPICGVVLNIGDGANMHVNRCLDKPQKDANWNGKFQFARGEEMEAKTDAAGRDGRAAVTMDRRQMAACASALMREQKGSKQFNDMLNMFECLGFNQRNMRSAIDESPGTSAMAASPATGASGGFGQPQQAPIFGVPANPPAGVLSAPQVGGGDLSLHPAGPAPAPPPPPPLPPLPASAAASTAPLVPDELPPLPNDEEL